MASFPLLIAYFLLVCAPVEAQQDQSFLRIVTLHSPPFVYAEDGKFTGYLVDILEELRKQIRFEYELVAVSDGKYGSKENGRWNGLMGELVSQRAHMALAPLTITGKRNEAVDFTTPYMHTGLSMAFKKPAYGQPLPFQTILDMVGIDDIRYGCVKSGSTYQFFNDSRYRLYDEMGSYMKTYYNELPESVGDGIEMVDEGNFVFLGEQVMLDFWKGSSCNVLTIGNIINTVGYGLAFPRGYTMTQLFSQKILGLREAGVLDRLKAKWWVSRCPQVNLCVCDKDVSSEEEDGDDSGAVATGFNALFLVWLVAVFV